MVVMEAPEHLRADICEPFIQESNQLCPYAQRAELSEAGRDIVTLVCKLYDFDILSRKCWLAGTGDHTNLGS